MTPKTITVRRDAATSRGVLATARHHRAVLVVLTLLACVLAAVGISLARADGIGFGTVVMCTPAFFLVTTTAMTFVRHAVAGLTSVSVTFSPNGIVEEIEGKRFRHPWTWLVRFDDESDRLVLHLRGDGRKHVLVVDKRKDAAIARGLVVLFAEYGGEGIARFEGSRDVAPARPARSVDRSLN